MSRFCPHRPRNPVNPSRPLCPFRVLLQCSRSPSPLGNWISRLRPPQPGQIASTSADPPTSDSKACPKSSAKTSWQPDSRRCRSSRTRSSSRRCTRWPGWGGTRRMTRRDRGRRSVSGRSGAEWGGVGWSGDLEVSGVLSVLEVLVELMWIGKHTSVTKEASKAMKDLKNKRKAMGERAQRIVGVAWSHRHTINPSPRHTVMYLPTFLPPYLPTSRLPDLPSPTLHLPRSIPSLTGETSDSAPHAPRLAPCASSLTRLTRIRLQRGRNVLPPLPKRPTKKARSLLEMPTVGRRRTKLLRLRGRLVRRRRPPRGIWMACRPTGRS